MYACLSVFVCPTDGIRGYENWMVYCRKRFFFASPFLFFLRLQRMFTREEDFGHVLFSSFLLRSYRLG